jgi:hypothetical protein
MPKKHRAKRGSAKNVLRLPDLDHSKASVLQDRNLLTRRDRPQRVSGSNAIGHTPVAGPHLQSRIDRLAFQCQNPEDTLMGAPQRFFADKPFKCFDAEGELAPSQ